MDNNTLKKLVTAKPLKVLVVSQKGGVGKSTLSANFSAYCGKELKKKTLLLDCDPHASASSWLKALKPENVEIKHHLINDFTAQRWFIGMRNVIRKSLHGFDFLVCDLTWTKSMSAEFVKEFDLIIIPTSVSLIEIDATNIFIEENLKKVAKSKNFPDLLICPSQVINDELKLNPFDSRTFNFPFFSFASNSERPSGEILVRKRFYFRISRFHGQRF
jgi:cellulose biosynthesis protein BcsQ